MNFCLTFNGTKNENIFSAASDYLSFMRSMVAAKKRYSIAVYAFCLMTDHVKIIIGALNEENIAGFFCSLKQNYADDMFDRHGRKKIWSCVNQVRLLTDSVELFDAVRSVEYVPVNSGLVKQPIDYPYSSAYYRNLGAKTFEKILVNDPEFYRIKSTIFNTAA